jgi:hypothetical protein
MAQDPAATDESTKTFLLSDDGSFNNSALNASVNANRTLRIAASFEDDDQDDDGSDTGDNGDTGSDEDENDGDDGNSGDDDGNDNNGSTDTSFDISPSLRYAVVMREIADVKEKRRDAGLESQSAQVSELLGKKDAFLKAEQERLVGLGVSQEKQDAYFDLIDRQFDALENPYAADLQSAETLNVKIPPKPSSFTNITEPVFESKVRSLPEEGEEGFQALSLTEEPTGDDPVFDVTEQHLTEDDEQVVINMEIAELAEELDKNPAKIYAYLRDNIHYEPYYGAKKGSVGCLAQKVCNDVDTASLQIALLRASGIPARYRMAKIIVRVETLQQLLGVEETRTVFYTFGINKVPVFSSYGVPVQNIDTHDFSNDEHLSLDWVYAEAYYDYDDRAGNYRNMLDFSEDIDAVITEHPELAWLPVDPLISEYTHIQNEIVHNTANFDTIAFLNSYLQYQGDLTPLEKYAEDLQSQTGKDITDPAYQSIHQLSSQTKPIIPATTPYFLLSEDAVFAELPDSLKVKIRFSVLREADGSVVFEETLPGVAVDNTSLDLFYLGATETDTNTIQSYGGIYATPPALVDLVPALNDGTEVYTTTNTVNIGELLILQTDYFLPGQTTADTSNQTFVHGGNVAGIHVSLSTIEPNEDLDITPDEDPDVYSHILLEGNAEIARQYLRRNLQNLDLLSNILDRRVNVHFSQAVVKQVRDLNPVDGDATTFETSGLSIDAGMYFISSSRRGNYNNHDTDLLFLWGLQASYDEAKILTDITSMDAISTVPGMQLAYANPTEYTIHTITSANESVIDTLSLSANTKANMHADVQNGNTIITPDKPVTDGEFSGILYVSYELNEASARFAIGEQVQNGGWITDDMIAMDTTNPLWLGLYAYQRSQDPDGNYFSIQNPSGDLRDYGDIKCNITNEDRDSIMQEPSWDDAYGVPCFKPRYQPSIAGFDHVVAIATNGAKFYSPQQDGYYDYWVGREQIKTAIKDAFDDYTPSGEPHTFEIEGLQWDHGGFKFNKALRTYSWDGKSSNCDEHLFAGLCSDADKWVKAYYSPSETNQSQAYLVYGHILTKLNDSEVYKNIGFPTGNRDQAAPSNMVLDADRYYQNFANGQIYSYDWYQKRWTYFTYANFTDFHQSNSGTGGSLGFPQGDPSTDYLQGQHHQFFEEGSWGKDQELVWNGSESSAAEVHNYRNFDCENNLWGLLDQLPGNVDNGSTIKGAVARVILFVGVFDSVESTFSGIGELGAAIYHEIYENWSPNDWIALYNLGLRPEAFLIELAAKSTVEHFDDAVLFFREFDIRLFFEITQYVTNDAIAQLRQEYNSATCAARRSYLMGRIVGETVQVIVPAKGGINFFRAALKASKAKKLVYDPSGKLGVSIMAIYGTNSKKLQKTFDIWESRGEDWKPNAHHIVPHYFRNGISATPEQKQLISDLDDLFGGPGKFDLDYGRNGVVLPKGLHPGGHRPDYYDEIYNRLEGLKAKNRFTRQGVENELNAIRKQLLRNEFEPPNNSWFDASNKDLLDAIRNTQHLYD